MSKVVVTECVSPDGVMEGPDGAEPFEHGGWTDPHWNDEPAAFRHAGLFASDALLSGRVTHEGLAARASPRPGRIGRTRKGPSSTARTASPRSWRRGRRTSSR